MPHADRHHKARQANRQLVPIDDKPIDIFGRMAGTIRICGDIISPIDVEWTGDADNI